jgi:hypothetical protein
MAWPIADKKEYQGKVQVRRNSLLGKTLNDFIITASCDQNKIVPVLTVKKHKKPPEGTAFFSLKKIKLSLPNFRNYLSNPKSKRRRIGQN